MGFQGFATIAALGIGLVLSVGILAYEIYNSRTRYYSYSNNASNTFTYPDTSISTSRSSTRRRRRSINDKSCVVCLESFDDDKEALKILCCGHCFHSTCIDAWFAVSNSCPICRANSTL